MAVTTLPRSASLVRPMQLFRKRCVQNIRLLLPVLTQTSKNCIPIATYHATSVRLGDALYVDHDLAAATQDEAKTITYPLQHVEFTTCHSLYDENSLTSGLTFRAAYIDTHPGAGESMPTVVTLHGSPGSHLDFKHMIEFLPKHNMRVISLNFPGFYWTPMDSANKFGHTTLEKTSFLTDFLKTINVSKIDVIAVHSAGTYPATRLCVNTNIVRSMLLINPAGHRYMKSFDPRWYFRNHAQYSRTPILQTLLLIFLKIRLVALNSPNKDALLMSAAIETLAKLDYEQQQKAISKLAKRKFPVYLMYSENDHGVEAEISNELAMRLGGSPDLMERYDPKANIINPVTSTGDHIFHGYVFEKGGHFLMKRHPDIVNQAILNLFYSINKIR